MKFSSVTLLAALAVVPPVSAQEEIPKPVFRDVATHDALVSTFKEVSSTDPMKQMEKAQGTDPSKENQPQNLIESSDLISFRGVTTLVPKRAILQIPKKFEKRINNHVPGDRIVGWLDFYRMNRAWITTVEISRGQAGGNEALGEELSEQLAKSKNLVVTVLDSGPISSMPFRGESKEEG